MCSWRKTGALLFRLKLTRHRPRPAIRPGAARFVSSLDQPWQNRSQARASEETSSRFAAATRTVRACTGRRDVSNGLTPGHLVMGSAEYDASAMPFDFRLGFTLSFAATLFALSGQNHAFAETERAHNHQIVGSGRRASPLWVSSRDPLCPKLDKNVGSRTGGSPGPGRRRGEHVARIRSENLGSNSERGTGVDRG